MNKLLKSKPLVFGIFILGLVCSPLFVVLLEDYYHHDDINAFIGWSQYLGMIKYSYVSTCPCNYPILGLFSSQWMMNYFDENVLQFRLFLSIFDVLSIICISYTLKHLQVKKHFLWATLIGILPSSWVGGALWGQIDTISQFLLLLNIVTLVFIYIKLSSKHPIINGIISGFVICLVLLTKQLAFFSAITLSIAHFLFFYKFAASSLKKTIIFGLSFSVAIYIPFTFFDHWLELKEGFISHLHYVLAIGSSHMKIISGNGFNIWMFFNPDMLSSSTTPLVGPLHPKLMGTVLYLVYLISTGITFIIFFFKKEKSVLFQIGNTLYFLALVNLGFNIFLTGTHERYLYHFYPFIIIALISLNQVKWLLHLTIVGGILYGGFVFSIMVGYEKNHLILSGFHIILLILLTFNYKKLAPLNNS